MSMEFKTKQEFDSKRMRHYLNGELSVLHCHHYATLFTQLADDAKLLKGDILLAEAAEETMSAPLVKYFEDNGVTSVEDRVSIAEQYFNYIGLGQIKINVSEDGGSAEMAHSHVDEGWIKKWGKREKPLNYMGRGFLAGAFAAITGNKTGTFKAEETQSLVVGDESSKFTIKKI